MRVKVELRGPLAWLAKRDELALDIGEGASLLDALRTLCEKMPELHGVIFDPDTGDPRTNFLILLNGRDVDVLGGLGARLGEGDVITLVPLVRI